MKGKTQVASQNPCDEITAKERLIIGLVVADFKDVAIAAELEIAVSTVRSHLRSIRQKLGVHTRVGMVVKWLEYLRRTTLK